jgi:hypothetical protein
VTEIQDKYLVTDDIDVQWLFLGTGATHLETRIMRSLVLSALKPVVEQKAAFVISKKTQADEEFPHYLDMKYIEHQQNQGWIEAILPINSLTKYKTCGEIRKLLAWAEGKT